jgi:multiple sugar transport system substrate-binding protein
LSDEAVIHPAAPLATFVQGKERQMKNLCWAALATLAAGCVDEAPSMSPMAAAPVALKVWRHDNASYKQANDDAFAAYTATHGNVTITAVPQPWQSYTGALSADLKHDQLAYDLVLMPPASICTYAANLMDVPASVASLSEAQNTFFAPPLEGATCNGVLKGLPVEYNLEYGGVIVNLDKYQAKFPGKTPGWSDWSGFLADASALAERDGEKPCTNGLDIDNDWPEPVRHILLSQILQRGGRYWTASGEHLFDFNTQEAHASLVSMVDWVVQGKVLSPALIPDKNTFVTIRLGRGATGYGCGDPAQPLSAMGYVGTWGLPASVAERPPGSSTRFDFYALPPMVGTEHRFVQNAGFAFAVPRTSKNAQVAWDLVKSIALSPTAMRRWAATAGTLPALKANGTRELAAADPVLARVQPLLERGQWMGDIPYGATAEVLGAMVTNYFAAVKGEKSIDQALADMQQKANAAILMNR